MKKPNSANMKKFFLLMACTVLGLGSCTERPRPLEIDNALTAEEIAAGRFTPEVMWKMGRLGGSQLSPDGKWLVYTVTYYNLGENRGVTALYLRDMASGEVRQLTDHTSNNTSPAWSADGRTLYFLSDRSGTQQVWRMAAAGGEPQQVTAFDADVEGKKAAFKEAGIEYTIRQIDQYRACGINGIHLYALNKYDDVARIAKEAGLLDLI